MSSKSIEHWKSNPAGPGSGVVALIRATGKVVYNGRLDKGPHAGKAMRTHVRDGAGPCLRPYRRALERRNVFLAETLLEA